jgi:putative transcription factor
MANCEMCGRERDKLVEALVEGSMLNVCSDCGKHGNVVTIYRPEAAPKVENSSTQEEPIDIVVDNYPEIVKSAREKKKLTQEELAKDIGERESVVHQVESGKMKPTFKLAKKLNVYLGIQLIEKVEKINVKKDIKNIDFKDKSLTIADLLKKDE